MVFSNLIWKIPTHKKTIYLTFDDGPTPGVTTQVLALLHQYNARATFFCLGSQVEKHPDMMGLIKEKGHVIGNHGYQHFDGFFTSTRTYVKNAEAGALLTESKLFRPPYGRINPLQYFKLKKKYKIVLWSVMSKDYEMNITPEHCLKRTIKRFAPGAIIVFHDSEKAAKNVLTVLPEVLKKLQELNYRAEVLRLE
jgi:peptidoglycan/xylan/chitin deacetylase (PgdA/CDA1 family)